MAKLINWPSAWISSTSCEFDFHTEQILDGANDDSGHLCLCKEYPRYNSIPTGKHCLYNKILTANCGSIDNKINNLLDEEVHIVNVFGPEWGWHVSPVRRLEF